MENPRVAVLMLTAQCAMSCSFCINGTAMCGFSAEQAQALIRRLRNEGFRSLVLGGGEPLDWRYNAFELAADARKLGFVVQLGTNGISLPENFATYPHIDRYVLPLDGARAATHNAVRRWKGDHFAVIKERLASLRGAGKSTTISTVVTKKNAGEIASIFEWLQSWNEPRPFLHAWHLYRFVPEGRGGARNQEALDLCEEEYRKATSVVKKELVSFSIFRRPDMLRSKTVEFFWLEEGLVQAQLCQRRRTFAA